MEKEIKKTKSGAIYFEVSRDEMLTKLNGLGLCDSCRTPMQNGFLVPVLNYTQCEKCFLDSVVQNAYYEEDRAFEEEKTALYKKALEQ